MSTYVYARGTRSRLLACTFIIRECALPSSGLSIYEEMYTVQLLTDTTRTSSVYTYASIVIMLYLLYRIASQHHHNTMLMILSINARMHTL